MPRITGLLKNGPKLQASAAKNFSFTVSGQDSAKVSRSQLMDEKQVIKPWQFPDTIIDCSFIGNAIYTAMS